MCVLWPLIQWPCLPLSAVTRVNGRTGCHVTSHYAKNLSAGTAFLSNPYSPSYNHAVERFRRSDSACQYYPCIQFLCAWRCPCTPHVQHLTWAESNLEFNSPAAFEGRINRSFRISKPLSTASTHLQYRRHSRKFQAKQQVKLGCFERKRIH